MDKFSYEANGYNREEVNNFVKNVIVQTEKIVEKTNNQNTEINNLKKELEEYKNSKEILNSTISLAEKNKNDIIRLANEEKEMIISQAKDNASRIVNEALLRAEKLEFKADLLESKLKILKRKLKSILEEQASVVEDIEDIEIN